MRPRPVVTTIPLEDRHVPISEQIETVKREIGLRQKVYPTRVSNGRMTLRMAIYQLAAMRSVLKTLEELAAKERLL